MTALKDTSTQLKALNITRPTLVLDRQQTLLNLKVMADKAQKSGVKLRPHAKTHQSADLAHLGRSFNIISLTASSLDMALYFADNGQTDITVAIPANILEIDKINELASLINLRLITDNPHTITFLANNLQHPIELCLEADLGYRRTGVSYEDLDQALTLARLITKSPNLIFAGLLTHSGNTYTGRSKEDILAIHNQALGRLQTMQTHLLENGIPSCPLSIGDTPACSVADDLSAVDEIRPGNFIFYDLMQAQIGSCTSDQVSVAVACPIIGLYPERQTAVLYGGGVHFAKDHILNEDGTPIYGQLTTIENNTFTGAIPAATLTGLSQEHGTLTLTDPALFNQLSLGDLLLILPIHSCMTADLYSNYLDLSGQRYSRIPRQP